MKVKVFTKHGCPQCNMTKSVLDGEGVEYELINVQEDAEAMAYVKDELGITSMPVVQAEGHELIVGFQPDRLQELAK